jgi:hypothetical protein
MGCFQGKVIRKKEDDQNKKVILKFNIINKNKVVKNYSKKKIEYYCF